MKKLIGIIIFSCATILNMVAQGLSHFDVFLDRDRNIVSTSGEGFFISNENSYEIYIRDNHTIVCLHPAVGVANVKYTIAPNQKEKDLNLHVFYDRKDSVVSLQSDVIISDAKAIEKSRVLIGLNGNKVDAAKYSIKSDGDSPNPMDLFIRRYVQIPQFVGPSITIDYYDRQEKKEKIIDDKSGLILKQNDSIIAILLDKPKWWRIKTLSFNKKSIDVDDYIDNTYYNSKPLKILIEQPVSNFSSDSISVNIAYDYPHDYTLLSDGQNLNFIKGITVVKVKKVAWIIRAWKDTWSHGAIWIPLVVLTCISIITLMILLLFKRSELKKKEQVETKYDSNIENNKVEIDEEKEAVTVPNDTIIDNKDNDTENNKLRKTINYLKDEIDELRNKLAAAEKEKDSLEQNHAKKLLEIKNKLENELKEKQTEIDRAKQQIDEYKRKNDSLNASNLGLNDTISKLKQENSNYNSIITDIKIKNQQELSETRINGERKLSDAKDEFNKQLKAAKDELLAKIEQLQDDYSKALAMVNNDRSSIVRFFKNMIDTLDDQLSTIINDCDPDSSVYPIISQLISSANGYADFKERVLGELLTNQPMDVVQNNLQSVILSDVDYEKSWFNNLIKIYVYSKVPKLEPIFGYYASYAQDIDNAFITLSNLANLMGISDIKYPRLFEDTFDSKKYDFKNTNLVLPEIYPDYVSMLVPMIVYDLSKVGYKLNEKTIKATVAYYPQN